MLVNNELNWSAVHRNCKPFSTKYELNILTIFSQYFLLFSAGQLNGHFRGRIIVIVARVKRAQLDLENDDYPLLSPHENKDNLYF